ncbi:MAG: hypothetical protein ACYC49_03510 [Ignavibacteriaceae bacterium]
MNLSYTWDFSFADLPTGQAGSVEMTTASPCHIEGVYECLPRMREDIP